MKIALLGYGKMGKAIETIARDRNHSITALISPNDVEADFSTISSDNIADADICIDFSHPDAVLNNVKISAEAGKNLVIGTTGWYDKILEIEAIAKDNDIGVIYAANFSIGVNIFYEIIEHASKIINAFDSYDISCHETHHTEKVDSPSGTAKVIGEIILKNISRKEIILQHVEGKIPSHALLCTSSRLGYNPGSHHVTFDSEADTITLQHQARSRDGFAHGAVSAGEWILGKKGFFNINDYIHEIIQ